MVPKITPKLEPTVSQWAGKVVLVTGASSGIGLAIARAFSKRGAKLVLAARRVHLLETEVKEMNARGGEALALAVDITDPEAVTGLINQTVDHFGGLDVLVNSAGRSTRSPIEETSAEDFRDLMNLNFFALVDCTHKALPHILKGKGHIVHISSLAGKSAGFFHGAYPASKHAVNAYAQQLRLELKEKGVNTLCVCPGPVDTNLLANSISDDALNKVPDSAKKVGAGLKTKVLSPDFVAEATVDACEAGTGELLFPWYARFFFMAQQLSSGVSDFIVRMMT